MKSVQEIELFEQKLELLKNAQILLNKIICSKTITNTKIKYKTQQEHHMWNQIAQWHSVLAFVCFGALRTCCLQSIQSVVDPAFATRRAIHNNSIHYVCLSYFPSICRPWFRCETVKPLFLLSFWGFHGLFQAPMVRLRIVKTMFYIVYIDILGVPWAF